MLVFHYINFATFDWVTFDFIWFGGQCSCW